MTERDSVPVDFEHAPVMLQEVLETFETIGEGLLVDATVGGAGHSLALLEQQVDRQILGIDRDETAVMVARERLEKYSNRAKVVHATFDQIGALVDDSQQPLAGAIFDLGVSSYQLDTAGRGFSHRFDAPLDMRMNSKQDLNADIVVNTYEEKELRWLLRRNADEKHSSRIAAGIVNARPVRTTRELADVVRDSVPAAVRRLGRHPAMRTFQAIRIEVNDELSLIEPAIRSVIERLQTGGRIAVLSYHSGEDRIVKHLLREAADGLCHCPSSLPCVCGAGPTVRLLKRKVRRPTESEIAHNPRATSARFRSAERLPAGEL